jgi:cystinosin
MWYVLRSGQDYCSSLICAKIYLLGNFKALLTFIKYAPQVLLNYKRKSTRGLSIFQFTLDLTGAILSLLQLGMDSTSNGDWSSVLNNPAKFALGNVTLFFDVIFYIQHYCLYPASWKHDEGGAKLVSEDSTEPLLGALAAPTI